MIVRFFQWVFRHRRAEKQYQLRQREEQAMKQYAMQHNRSLPYIPVTDENDDRG
jgi:hypothetical protein